MPLYRYARDNLLENAWGDNPRAYPERFTIVRETTSLGGERAQQAAYSLPSQRFSLALSFPHPPLSCGERTDEILSHDFLRKIYSAPFCAASWEGAALHHIPQGDGEEGKWGTGGENPEGEGE